VVRFVFCLGIPKGCKSVFDLVGKMGRLFFGLSYSVSPRPWPLIICTTPTLNTQCQCTISQHQHQNRNHTLSFESFFHQESNTTMHHPCTTPRTKIAQSNVQSGCLTTILQSAPPPLRGHGLALTLFPCTSALNSTVTRAGAGASADSGCIFALACIRVLVRCW
jgi:hypothetical protein